MFKFMYDKMIKITNLCTYCKLSCPTLVISVLCKKVIKHLTKSSSAVWHSAIIEQTS